jgi:uncharacterized membrane protein
MTGRRTLDIAAVALAVALLGSAWWIWRYGPTGPLPMHFDLHGRVDRWGDRNEAAAVIAVLAVAGSGLYALIPAFARGATLTPATRRSLVLGQAIVLTVMAFVAVLMTSIGVGLIRPGEDMTGFLRASVAMLGGVLAVTGAVLGKTSPNPVVGVRVYWTLTSRAAWEKSNRLLGRILFWGGLLALVASPFAPPLVILAIVLASGVGGGLISTFEAWRVWRSDPDRTSI